MAADVVADTFLIAWRRIQDIPTEQARLWLFGVARKVLARHRRQAQRRVDLAVRLRAELRQVDVKEGSADYDLKSAFCIEAEQDELIQRVAATYHLPESVATPTSPAAEELLDMIMKTSESVVIPARPVRRTPFWSRRRLLVGATAMAALAITAGILLPPDRPGGPAPAQAVALEIATDGDYLEISINDPVADAERYRAELAEHGLDIELSLAPADPDRVGRVIFQEVGDTGTGPTLEVIEAPGDCGADGSCSVVIRVPVAFSSYAHIVLGRTPLPGEGGVEGATGDAPVLTPEESQRIASLIGMRVAEARTALAESGWTADYRVGDDSRAATADEVPDDWYVTDAAPVGGGVIVLWADPDRG